MAISARRSCASVLFDAWQLELYEALSTSTRRAARRDRGEVASRRRRYHLRYSSGWLVRLGDGTAESHARVARALDALWPYTGEMFVADDVDREAAAAGIAPRRPSVAAALERARRRGARARPRSRPGRRPDSLARQAGPAQRASRLPARGDAVAAARASGRDTGEAMGAHPGRDGAAPESGAAERHRLREVTDPEIPVLSRRRSRHRARIVTARRTSAVEVGDHADLLRLSGDRRHQADIEQRAARRRLPDAR